MSGGCDRERIMTSDVAADDECCERQRAELELVVTVMVHTSSTCGSVSHGHIPKGVTSSQVPCCRKFSDRHATYRDLLICIYSYVGLYRYWYRLYVEFSQYCCDVAVPCHDSDRIFCVCSYRGAHRDLRISKLLTILLAVEG